MSGEGEVAIRLLIADDHALVRSGLRSMLQREPGIEIVARPATAARPWSSAAPCGRTSS